MSHKITIQCDFDGTLTNEDISFKILNRYATINWREVLKRYMDEEISVGQFNQKVFRSVKENRSTLLKFIEENKDVRDGVPEFLAFCQQSGLDLHIVSNGLELYIKHILDSLGYSNIPIHAASSVFTDDGMDSIYCDPYGKETMYDYKAGYSKYFKEQADEVVYIGNGSSDFAPAKLCHYVFSTDTLSRKCLENNVIHTHFDSLYTVIEGLQKRYNL